MTQRTNNPSPAHAPAADRHSRVGLWALVVFVALFTATALVAKIKLESLQDDLVRRAEIRLGAAIQVGGVQTEGLTGLRIHDIELLFSPPSGSTAKISVPEARLHVKLLPLLWGGLHVKRLSLDGAHVQVLRPAGADWPTMEELAPSLGRRDGAQNLLSSFHLVGQGARFDIDDEQAQRRLSLEAVVFDVQGEGRLGTLAMQATGALNGDAEKPISLALFTDSPASFNLEASGGGISADDINALFPPSHRLIEAGITTPSLRVRSSAPHGIDVDLTAPFEDVVVRGQPPFMAPVAGAIEVHARYDSVQRALVLERTRLQSCAVEGTLAGQISLADEVPVLDLLLTATGMPLEAALHHLLPPELAGHGDLRVQLKDPQEAVVALTGATAAPQYTITASGAGATFAFAPAKPNLPAATIELGALRFGWDSETRRAEGSANIVGGNVTPLDATLSATELTGVIRLDGDLLELSPVNATITGNRFVGSASFDLAQRTGRASASGVAANIEDTFIRTAFHNTLVSGSAAARAEAELSFDACSVTIELDATQTDIAFEWWFRKAPGTGALGTIDLEWRPGASITYAGEAELAASRFLVEGAFVHAPSNGQTWRLAAMDATSSDIDIAALGRCLQFPYRISGGHGTDAYFRWRQAPDDDSLKWSAEIGCRVDEIALLPDGGEAPMRLVDATLDGHVTRGDDSTGALTLHAADATMPPFTTTWFLPVRARVEHDVELMALHPEVDRTWSYSLRADNVRVPPWQGADFEAEAYTRPGAAGLSHYTAKIGDGELSGDYHSNSAENSYTVAASWTEAPIKFFLDHLELPEVLVGASTGAFRYSASSDDPGALQGNGGIEMSDGLVNTDMPFADLGADLEGELTALPRAVPFSMLRIHFHVEGDRVSTPEIELISDGIDLSASGHFVREGDMDYIIRVAIAPEMAEKVPAIRNNFNVRGHRIAQQRIALAFNVTGPTFSPRGELAELPPASVTLVSGALGITDEAIKVIDLPRRILVDLLKTAGGIMGAGR